MTYVLHNRLGSGGFPVEAMLELCGLDYRYDPIDSVPGSVLGAKIGHVNKWGQVPALETPGGETITELAAILAYLDQTEAACRSGPHLWNDDPGQFLRWCVFLSVNVYESVLRRVYPDRYIVLEGCDEAEIRNLSKRVGRAGQGRAHEALLLIEHELNGRCFLLGERMSAVDIYLAMVTAWSPRQPDLPNCTRVAELVACHEIIRPIWLRNFDHRLKETWHEARPLWR